MIIWGEMYIKILFKNIYIYNILLAGGLVEILAD